MHSQKNSDCIKNYIIIFIILLIIINLPRNENEHMTDVDALANVASLYNNQNMTVSNLNITGNLSVDGNIVSKHRIDAIGIIKSNGGLVSPAIYPGEDGADKGILTINGNKVNISGNISGNDNKVNISGDISATGDVSGKTITAKNGGGTVQLWVENNGKWGGILPTVTTGKDPEFHINGNVVVKYPGKPDGMYISGRLNEMKSYPGQP